MQALIRKLRKKYQRYPRQSDRNEQLVNQGKAVCAAWATRGVERNFGDNLNPYLISRLAGKPVINARDLNANKVHEIYGVIGSWLGNIWKPNLTVWGLGFISHDAVISRQPKRIAAVRGPMTKDKLANQGYSIDVPVGDPAILVALLYEPKSTRSEEIAVIAQPRDSENPIFREAAELDGFREIDICCDIEEFCEQLNECSAAVSSSLHAVVAAHSYGIPAQFVKVSDDPLGDGFKLLDYLSSVGLEGSPPIRCQTVDDIRRAADSALLPKNFPDLEALLNTCPFLEERQRDFWISKASKTFKL